MAQRFDSSRPIYLQIMEEIKKRAARGEYPPGGQLPSVRETAKLMGVNPNTVARVFLELEREGFITTRRGQGAFVTGDVARIDAERRRFADEAVARFVRDIGALGLDENTVRAIGTEVREALESGGTDDVAGGGKDGPA